ncbi:hypothetical protein OA249_02480 [Litorivicinus sp.]|nr:hypothetical protein [Litorivicinus sp.]
MPNQIPNLPVIIFRTENYKLVTPRLSRLNLSIATNDYNHFRDVRIRAVSPKRIDFNWFVFTHRECFARFTADREFDISELSFAKFRTQVTRENPDIIYVPLETLLIKDSKSRGLRTVGGLGMLPHQSRPAWRLWFGIDPEMTESLHSIIERDIRWSA